MRVLGFLATLGLVALPLLGTPSSAIISLGCPRYDTTLVTDAGTLHLASADELHVGAWLLEAGGHYLTQDGVSRNDELHTNFWVQVWGETNGVPGLQRGSEACYDCDVEGVEVECDAWLTGP